MWLDSPLVNYINSYASKAGDSEEVSLSKKLIFIIATICSICGLFWSYIYYVVFGTGLIMYLPLFFVLFVGSSIIISSITKNYLILVHTQIVCIWAISALIQWCIGSFNESGFVSAWTFLAPIGALMFLSRKEALFWMGIFIVTLCVSVFAEPKLLGIKYEVSDGARALFYLMNIGTPALVTFFAAQYFVNGQIKQKLKNKELHKIAQEKNDEILDSISYAKRIQGAMLPTMERIKELLPDYFVLYKPKDIVAGDFYWVEKINDTVLVAAADCTGHGVPGAMVSVVCSNALERSVREFHLSDTGEILNKVQELVTETLSRSNKDVKDGMDISLLSINYVTKKIQWSGANNPLWYFTDNVFYEIKADKQPIGQHDFRKPFTTHEVNFRSGTTFYLFTDGYADQFGGQKGKKFMYKQMQHVLEANLSSSLAIQESELENAFENWKGEIPQVDDVCIFAVRI